MAWTKNRWIVGGALAAVGVALLFSERGNQTVIGGFDTYPRTSTDTGATGTTSAAGPCTVTITADALSARSSPDGNARVVDTYRKGEVVSADRTVRNGFRQLAPDRWAPQEFLQPTPGSDCG